MLRIVFMGTPDFAVPTLAEIVAAGHRSPRFIRSRRDPPGAAGRPQSRRSTISPMGAGIPVLTPRRLRRGRRKRSSARIRRRGGRRRLWADPAETRARCARFTAASTCTARRCRAGGARRRSSAPIMAGDRETAAAIMRMDEGLDTGPVCCVHADRDRTRHDRGRSPRPHGGARRGLDGRALATLERGALTCTPQPRDGVTYAEKIDKDEARIDWLRPATEVHNKVRGLAPWPGAYFEVAPGGRRAHQGAARRHSAAQRRRADLRAPFSTARRHDCLRRRCHSPRRGAARRPPADAGAELLRGFPLPRGTQL